MAMTSVQSAADVIAIFCDEPGMQLLCLHKRKFDWQRISYIG